MRTILTSLFTFSLTLSLFGQPLQLDNYYKFDIERTVSFQHDDQAVLGVSFSTPVELNGQTYESMGGTDLLIFEPAPGNGANMLGQISGPGHETFYFGHFYEDQLYAFIGIDDTVNINLGNQSFEALPDEDLETRIICKYEINGNIDWAGKILNPFGPIHQILGNENGVLIAGAAQDSLMYVSPNNNITKEIFPDQFSAYLIQLDPQGEVIWHQNYIYDNPCFANALTIGGDKIYFGVDAILGSDFNQLDFDGNTVFSYHYTQTSIKDIQIDEDQSIYVTGHYFFLNSPDWDFSEEGEYFTDGGQVYEIMVVKYNDQLDFQWHLPITGDNIDTGTSLAFGDNNDFYLTGCIQRDADFDPTEEEFILNAWGTEDIFIANYTKEGDFNFAYNLGGSSGDIGFDIRHHDGVIDVFGIFRNTMNIDLQGETVSLTDENDDIGASYFWISYLNCAESDCTTNQSDLEKENIALFPNPFTDKFQIRTEGLIEYLTVYNALGQNVFSTQNPSNSIDLAYLPKGIYLVELKTDQQNFVEQIVKY